MPAQLSNAAALPCLPTSATSTLVGSAPNSLLLLIRYFSALYNTSWISKLLETSDSTFNCFQLLMVGGGTPGYRRGATCIHSSAFVPGIGICVPALLLLLLLFLTMLLFQTICCCSVFCCCCSCCCNFSWSSQHCCKGPKGLNLLRRKCTVVASKRRAHARSGPAVLSNSCVVANIPCRARPCLRLRHCTWQPLLLPLLQESPRITCCGAHCALCRNPA